MDFFTISDLKQQYQQGLTSQGFLDKAYNLIQKDSQEPKPSYTFISLTQDLAYQQASQIKDFSLPLAGIPIAIKDNIHIKGQKTTCGSLMLSSYQAIFDATVVEKLKEAGALLIGKANMDEFSIGFSGENSYFKPTLCPYNKNHSAGGSSSGSALSVAKGFTPIALGSDTGGGVRIPAAFCGVVGFKPSYGRISRYGLVAYASSLDHIGIFSSCIQDAALVFLVLAGKDKKDGTSLQDNPSFSLDNIKKPCQDFTVGIPQEYFENIDPEIQKALDGVCAFLKSLNIQIKPVSLPHLTYALQAYTILSSAEASSNLARLDGIRYGKQENNSVLAKVYTQSRGKGLGEEVKQQILLGTQMLSQSCYQSHYVAAQKARTLIINDFKQAFKEVNALLTPTTIQLAPLLKECPLSFDQDIQKALLTLPANLAGLPALSMPVEKSSLGLPIGMQLITDFCQEERLLQLAYNIEQGLKK